MPLYDGEKVVLRLLTGGGRPLSLGELGMPVFMIDELKKIICKRSGLILITGPTGSGKSTTLYSLLRLCNAEHFNILTIEDPVEYQLSDINQVQVNQSGLSFSVALRSALRQDPDIIFIGEIRDVETAAIALRAALTGHLVMATLHTRDSKEAVIRLKDLGVPDYLLKDTIRAVLAQRLYRKLCLSCRGQGCPACEGDGFLGRSGIFEYYDPEKQTYYNFEQAKQDILSQGLTVSNELFFI
jgi:general secretion pathway protein E